MSTDFRAEAAEATLRKLGGGSLADLNESGCLWVMKGRGLRYALEVPSLLTTLVCLATVLGTALLATTGTLSRGRALALTAAALVVLLVFRKARSVVLRTILRRRADSLIGRFPELPARAVGIEEGKTVEKVKLLTEDEGVCLLDAPRQRLLIEGCAFRHVIYAKDVSSVEAISGYALSGARVVCRMAGQNVDMVVKSSGQGPLASLVQAFLPSAQAAGLATVLNRTLFGTETAGYKQNLPPPLPRGV